MARGKLTMAVMVAMVAVGCASGTADEQTSTSPTSEPPRTTTTTAAATTTTAAMTTTTQPATALEALGYPVSDEWVMETIVAGLDAATGGLAIDPDGVMYQADFGYAGHPGDTVYRITPGGVPEVFAHDDDMASLTMTTFGPDGTMYQSSYGSDTVYTIASDGTTSILAEGLRGPTGIVAFDDGTVYVEAYNSNIIHRIAPDGTIEDWVFDRRFNGINGLTAGPDGTLYVADHKDGSIFAVDADGEVTKLHQFPKATSHLLYDDGWLYVTSRLGYVVFRYELATGYVEIIAGNAEAGDADGRGAEGAMGRPNAITKGPDGALYINDGSSSGNNPVSIRRISHQP